MPHRLFKEDRARAVDRYIDFFGGADRSGRPKRAAIARRRKPGGSAALIHQAEWMRCRPVLR